MLSVVDTVYGCVLCVSQCLFCLLPCVHVQECNNNLETATAVMYSSYLGGGMEGGDGDAAPSHVTRGSGDGATNVPVVDQATGTQHSEH